MDKPANPVARLSSVAKIHWKNIQVFQDTNNGAMNAGLCPAKMNTQNAMHNPGNNCYKQNNKRTTTHRRKDSCTIHSEASLYNQERPTGSDNFKPPP